MMLPMLLLVLCGMAIIFPLAIVARMLLRTRRALKSPISRNRVLGEMSQLAAAAYVLCWITLAVLLCVVVVWVGVAVVMIFRALTVDAGTAHLVKDGLGISLTLSERGNELLLTLIDGNGGNALTALFQSVLFAAALFALLRFFKGVRDTRQPFSLARAQDIQHLALLVLSAGIVPGVLGAVALWGVYEAFDYGPRALGGNIVDAACIACGAFLLVFACIFRYGCVLQEQDDRLL